MSLIELFCPYCENTRVGMLSLAVHVSIEHNEKITDFVYCANSNEIRTNGNLKHKISHRARRTILYPIACSCGIKIRYEKTEKSNYNMPQEFHFQVIKGGKENE